MDPKDVQAAAQRKLDGQTSGWGPDYNDLISGMEPDTRHRYAQYRQALRENTIDGRVYHSPEELAKVRNQAQALKSMFTKPGTDEDALFDMTMEEEDKLDSEPSRELLAKYGSAFASPQSAQARTAKPAPTQNTVTSAYSGGGRPMGFLERTYGTTDPVKIRQMQARYAAQTRGKR